MATRSLMADNSQYFTYKMGKRLLMSRRMFMGKRSLMADNSQYFQYNMGKRLLVYRRNIYYITTVLHTKYRQYYILVYTI